MKVALWATAAALGLFSAMHVFITYEHFRETPHRESVTMPALTALLAAGLAAWAIRRARSLPTNRPNP
jgi:hypothetical protein